MDDLSAELIEMIFDAEVKGLIKVKKQHEGKGQGRAMLADHINSSPWLKTAKGTPTTEQATRIKVTAFGQFISELREDPYRGTDDPLIVALEARQSEIGRRER